MSEVKKVSLKEIVNSHNPRDPMRGLTPYLATENFIHEDGTSKTAMELVHEFALSSDEAKRAEFVRLIETYEEGTDGLMELAESRRKDDLQPISLRKFTSTDGKELYEIIFGERRFLAQAYLYAKYGDKPEISATVRTLTPKEAFDIAIQENLRRQNPTDIEYGRIFRSYRDEINPATNKKYNLKEIAAELGFPGTNGYQFVRGREALTYLPEKDQAKLQAESRTNVTKAIEKGLALKNGKSADGSLPDKKESRPKSLTLKQVHALFDESRDKSDDYLQALADVQISEHGKRITLTQAKKASDARLKATEPETTES